jgi:hypothetical protein
MQINLTNFKKWVLQLLPYTIILILISILYTKCEREITNTNVSALNAEAKAYKLKTDSLYCQKKFCSTQTSS